MSQNYEFRALCSKDIFPVCNIISKIGVKEFKTCFDSDEVKKMIASAGKDEDVTSAVGASIFFDIAGIVMGNMSKCENEIYSFLSSVTGLKVAALQKMGLADFAELIIEFFKKDDLKDFMKVVSKFLK